MMSSFSQTLTAFLYMYIVQCTCACIGCASLKIQALRIGDAYNAEVRLLGSLDDQNSLSKAHNCNNKASSSAKYGRIIKTVY